MVEIKNSQENTKGHNKHSTTYSESGVDIDKANQLIDEIKPVINKTKRLGADIDIGGFGGIFDIKALNYEDPLIVSSTDGVGTKLLLAIENNELRTIGIDLVAMCVNDLIVQGAEPLFFLDYFATGSLSKDIAKIVISSIAEGCLEANCALIGGETAEMPGFYQDNHFDLAGFCVGAVERKKLLPQKISINDDIIGIKSSGIHSNGYSLVRKLINESEISLLSKSSFSNSTYLEEFLRPTRLYVKPVLNILKQNNGIKALANITGGGITENLPRIFSSKNIIAEIDTNKWKKNEIFNWLQAQGNISDSEMLKTFNCGIGMILIVDPKETKNILDLLESSGEEGMIIGKILEANNENQLVTYK